MRYHKFFCLLVVLLCVQSVNSKAQNKSIQAFIPKQYSLLDSASGDLNLDAYPDLVLILKKDGEDTSSDVIDHPEKRPLLFLTGKADGSWQLAARNDNSVCCVDCGGVYGDPYNKIVIKNGYCSIEHYGGSNWRWTRIITYKYDKASGKWFLHKDGGESYHVTDPEKTEEHVRSKKDFGIVPFEKFDIYKDN